MNYNLLSYTNTHRKGVYILMDITKQVKLILKGNLPKVIRFEKGNLMVGNFCYPEFVNNGKKAVLRKRLINYSEVNKLSNTLKNVCISLVSALRDDNFLGTKAFYMTLPMLKKYFHFYPGFETSFNKLIENGFITPLHKENSLVYKMTGKAILPRSKKLEFVVLD